MGFQRLRHHAARYKNLLAIALLGALAIAALPQVKQASASLTANQLHTRMLERRAVEAAIWGMPLANFDAMRQAYFRDAGAQYNDIMYWSRPSDWKNQTTTPNHSTLYVMLFVNLKDGPVVVDIPATANAGLYGSLLDAWTIPLINVGSLGQDKGQGARYVLLPPGYQGQVPDGYVPVHSTTFNNYSLLRVITKTTSDADLATGVDYLKSLKVYPLASAKAPAANRFLDMADKVLDGITPYDARFFDSVARMVAEEPVQPRDLSMMGQLKALDIGKGLSFNPDSQRKQLLDAAAGEAHAYLMEGYAGSGEAIWSEQRQWRSLASRAVSMGTRLSFIEPDKGLYLDERAYAWFAMFAPIVPPGPHVYMKSYQTDRGERLDGSHTYKLTIPANAPARDFWAVDVYDAQTAGFIREAKVVGLDSYNAQLKKNSDGSIDLYFGPTPPPGQEHNWISTRPGNPFFTLFRIYGPDKGIIDRSWVLNDIQQID
ncbi:DUF1254 domain-containing protein [Pseudomonas sp. JQ170]|uniref:DUF1254 domain-containing protein n=1 Tax=unclassified Pseudomonas TaxID=196821 RepID=UPI00264CB14F|nr:MULTISPECIES: DUF1254 domain-containing protein [unclassified Pseudomonas]MDN7139850.1 DUF1254 domain-containing protein [Pseudomonas sp. JQ170]WRO73696.1 DUF1254 domain-containing protein [Pseudomonas sp. 170C]